MVRREMVTGTVQSVIRKGPGVNALAFGIGSDNFQMDLPHSIGAVPLRGDRIDLYNVDLGTAFISLDQYTRVQIRGIHSYEFSSREIREALDSSC